MNQITKIIVERGEVKTYHSDEIIDKRDDYQIRYDSFYKGYIDYYVAKEVVSNNTVLFGQLSVFLYVPSAKYLQDENKWKNIVIEEYRKKFGKYQWYVEPAV